MTTVIILSVFVLAILGIALIRGAECCVHRTLRERLFYACLTIAALVTLFAMIDGPKCCLLSGLGLCFMVVGAVVDTGSHRGVVTEV
jgi:hypothetical protein